MASAATLPLQDLGLLPQRSAPRSIPQPPKKAMPPPAPLVSAVIVNFRQWENTVALTNQLDNSDCMRSGQAEVVLIDNDPDPHPLRRCVRGWGGVSLRCFNRNRGFARAVNEGCRRARGEWILLLNPDMRVPDEFLDRVVSAAEKLVHNDPCVGIVGFQLRHADGTRQGSTGPFPTLASVLTGLLRPRARRRCQPLRGPRRRPVPWATGCCLLVRRECWQEVGGFDEDFFLYYEDVDLCRRARTTGWTVWYEPSVRVTHFLPLHTRAVPPALRVVTRHALLTYAAKHWSRRQFKAMSWVVWTESWLRQGLSLFRGQSDAARHFIRLRALTKDLLAGRGLRARHRLLHSAESLRRPK